MNAQKPVVLVTGSSGLIGYSLCQALAKGYQIIGIPPKRLARILRFHSAFESIYSNPRRELTAIAYEQGYSDQSHFINDFKALSGKTPSTVQREAEQAMPSDFDVEFLQSSRMGGA